MDAAGQNSNPLRNVYNKVRNARSQGLNSENFSGAQNSKNSEKISTNQLSRRGEKANAASNLVGLEKAATNHIPLQAAGDVAGVKKNEEDAGGLYSGKGKQASSKGKGKFSKKGPTIGVILSLVLCGGFLSFGGLSMQLISWKENIVSEFGQNSAVLNKRSNYVLKKLLSTNTDVTSQNIFKNKTKFKISSNLQEKLKTQGIDYVESDDGTRMLVYTDADGDRIPIVASDADIGKVPSSVDIDGETINLNTSKATTLDSAKKNLKGFSTDLETATITFTGKIAGWFDSVTDNVLKRIGGDSPRNKTADLDNDSTKEEVNNVIYDNASDGSGNSSQKVIETDEDGNETGSDIESVDDSLEIGDVDDDAIKAKLTARAEAASKAAGYANIACTFLRSIGAIGVAVGAIQTANVINFALTYLELADKTKAGDANNSYNIAENNLNEETTTLAYDKDGNEERLTGSTTSSNGWNSVFSDTNLVDENSAEANMVNRESAVKTAISTATNGSDKIDSTLVSAIMSFGAGIAAFHTCNLIQVASAAIDMALLFTGGIGTALKAFYQSFKNVVISAVVTTAISAVVGIIIPLVASWLGSNLQSTFQGTVGGTALLSGGHAVQDSNLQASTGVYASNENAVELYAMTREVETEWAEYERATKSPFDASSQYTFLGSLVNTITPIFNQSGNSAVSAATSIASLASDSLVALVSDEASAASETTNYAISLASDDNCPNLSSVGVAGDFACNKYSGAYVSELTTLDSDTVYDWMASHTDSKGRSFFEKDGGEVKLDSSGNPVINASSDYGYYLVACVANDVQPGTMSSAVEGFIEKTTDTGSITGNTALNFGLNFVPGSDFLDGIQALEALDHEKWNSGQACTGNSGDATVDEEVRYFSMYNLDQRVFENMGIIEKSSTTAFLEEYYEENPVDNDSLEGIIAHYGGLSEEETDYVLGLIEYADFLANYDASTRYAFGAPVIEEESTTLEFDNENVLGGEFIVLNQIAYADIRNRTFIC